MAHDVFISYSSKDKQTADAICARLEQQGIRCWIAPRDILPGGTWAESIVDAIAGSRAMVLVFSSHANRSKDVLREVELAIDNEVAVIPFRIEAVEPSKGLKYYLATVHWLDALSSPMAARIETLCARIKTLTVADGPPAKGSSPGSPVRTAVVSPAPPPVPSPKPASLRAADQAEPGDSTHSVETLSETRTRVRQWLRAADQNKAGQALYCEDKYSEAEQYFQEAVRLDPTDPEYHNNLGNALLRQRKYSEAEEHHREAVRLSPASAYYQYGLGYSLYSQRKYAEAETCYREAVRLDPTNGTYQDQLGETLCEQHKYPQAEPYISEAVRLEPKNALFCHHLERLRSKLNHPGE